MKLLILNIIILIAANKVYTKYVPRNSSTPSPRISDTSQTSPKYEYREVILYLTPSEVEAMREDNKLLNEHLEKQHNLKYSENNHLYTQENKYKYPKNNDKSSMKKQDDESQAEYPISASKQKIKTQISQSYPKDLVLKNIEHEEGQNFRFIYIDLKKPEEDKLNEKSENPWIAIASRPKELELKTLPQQNGEFYQPAYIYKNGFNIDSLPRSYDQRELEKQVLYV